mmetsp:Transcript_13466/g.21030  ORF Transcript_13466/g.21030 Transcript_13466/m.21030 type:complete len:232 (-) Transcript_13466:2811-3506(-)
MNSSNSKRHNRHDQASNKNSTSKSHVRSSIRLKKGLEWGDKEQRKCHENLEVSEAPNRCIRRSTSNLLSDSNSLSSRAGSAYNKASVSPRTKKKMFKIKMKDNLSSNEESDLKHSCSPQGNLLPALTKKPPAKKRFSYIGNSKSLIEKVAKSESKARAEPQEIDQSEDSEPEDQTSSKKVVCTAGKKFMFTHDFPQNHPYIRRQKNYNSVYSLIKATRHIRTHISMKNKVG